MSRRRRLAPLVAILLLVVAALAGCAGSSPVSTDDQQSDPSAAPFPLLPFAEPGGFGPFAVGRRTFTVTDAARNRTLTVDAWYPVDAATASSGRYPLSRYVLAPGASYPAHIALDNPPPASGRFPVVVFSHGKPTIRFQSAFFEETMATFGFVVLAPDHPGSTLLDDYLPVGRDLVERSRDISFLLDRVAAGDGGLADIADTNHAATAGHSLGGYTALAMPIGTYGVPADPRVQAVIAFTPTTGYFSDAELRRLHVPTLLMGATADVLTPLVPNLSRPVQLVPGRPLVRVDLVGGTHSSFIETCAPQSAVSILRYRGYATIEQYEAATCPYAGLSLEAGHSLANLYASAFLKSTVAGDHRYDRYLTPGFAATHPEVHVTIR